MDALNQLLGELLPRARPSRAGKDSWLQNRVRQKQLPGPGPSLEDFMQQDYEEFIWQKPRRAVAEAKPNDDHARSCDHV